MGLRINSNIAALTSYNALNKTDRAVSSSLEKLSSGFRINKAADDAAGLVVSEGLKSQIGGLTVAARNAQDGVNVVQTADGALGTVTDILQRMRDLAVQAANSGSQDSTAQAAANTEFQQLNSELTRISNTTAFGAQKLLDGTFGGKPSVLAAASTITGVDASTGKDFSNMQLDLNGTVIDGKTISASTLTAKLTGFDKNASGANLAAGNYNSASHLQADLQTAVDNALTTAVGAGYKAGDVQVRVNDNGGGNWTVALQSTASATATPSSTGATISAAGAGSGDFGFGTTATTTTVVRNAGASFQIGANKGESLAISIDAVDANSLGTSAATLTNATNASNAISTIDQALKTVNSSRASLGAYQNRFEKTIDNLNTAIQNITASNSAIRDTDMAAEMTKFTKNQVLAQAGTSMLAQANSSTQNILTLLRG